MPNPIIINTTTIATATKGSAVRNGGGTIPKPIIRLDPIQIAGLVPMYDCAAVECRQPLDINCCWKNPVFGNVVSNVPVATSTYENDWNSFWIDLAIYGQNTGSATATWAIEKSNCNNDSPLGWIAMATITTNGYGWHYGLGSISNHPTYTGVGINWGIIFHTFGYGLYRIKVKTAMGELAGCLVSDVFDLKAWNCNLARGTVKFETTNSGLLGSVSTMGATFDLCGLNFSDSIRMKGFFGNKTIQNYVEVIDKFQNGTIEHIRDEAIQKWIFNSHPIPQDYSDRLSIYMMMAVTNKISDYNFNNADYNIKQMPITKTGNYEPSYYDSKMGGIRMMKVKVEFNAGIQNLISSLCCDLK